MSLADRIIATLSDPARLDPRVGNPRERRRACEEWRGRMLSARRVVATPGVAAAAAVLGVRDIDGLVSRLPEILVPHSSVWLEWPQAATSEALGIAREPGSPEWAGVYVRDLGDGEGGMVLTPVQLTSDTGDACLYPMSFLLTPRTPCHPVLSSPSFVDRFMSEQGFGQGGFREEERQGLKGAMAHMMVVCGMAMNGMRSLSDAKNEARLRACVKLAAHVLAVPTPGIREVIKDVERNDPRMGAALARAMAERAAHVAGDVRMGLALLALLGARSPVTRSRESKGPGVRVGSRTHPGRSFSLVELSVGGEEAIRAGGGGTSPEERTPPRLHEVRKHFRHRRRAVAEGCDHAWSPLGVGTREVCARCGGMRWQVSAHRRGDEGRGSVVPTYLLRP